MCPSLTTGCYVKHVQVTSEQETIVDDDKEKLKEQLAILNEAFTLAETEEEEEGKALVPVGT